MDCDVNTRTSQSHLMLFHSYELYDDEDSEMEVSNQGSMYAQGIVNMPSKGLFSNQQDAEANDIKLWGGGIPWSLHTFVCVLC